MVVSSSSNHQFINNHNHINSPYDTHSTHVHTDHCTHGHHTNDKSSHYNYHEHNTKIHKIQSNHVHSEHCNHDHGSDDDSNLPNSNLVNAGHIEAGCCSLTSMDEATNLVNRMSDDSHNAIHIPDSPAQWLLTGVVAYGSVAGLVTAHRMVKFFDPREKVLQKMIKTAPNDKVKNYLTHEIQKNRFQKNIAGIMGGVCSGFIGIGVFLHALTPIGLGTMSAYGVLNILHSVKELQFVNKTLNKLEQNKAENNSTIEYFTNKRSLLQKAIGSWGLYSLGMSVVAVTSLAAWGVAITAPYMLTAMALTSLLTGILGTLIFNNKLYGADFFPSANDNPFLYDDLKQVKSKNNKISEALVELRDYKKQFNQSQSYMGSQFLGKCLDKIAHLSAEVFTVVTFNLSPKQIQNYKNHVKGFSARLVNDEYLTLRDRTEILGSINRITQAKSISENNMPNNLEQNQSVLLSALKDYAYKSNVISLIAKSVKKDVSLRDLLDSPIKTGDHQEELTSKQATQWLSKILKMPLTDVQKNRLDNIVKQSIDRHLAYILPAGLKQSSSHASELLAHYA